LAFAIANDDYAKIIIDPTDNQTISEQPCVSYVYDMTSAFLFSMESETTIGKCCFAKTKVLQLSCDAFQTNLINNH